MNSTLSLPGHMPADTPDAPRAFPLRYVLGVLLGLPAASTLISLLLLEQGVFTAIGVDFFTAFWSLIALWYAAQIALVARVLAASNRRWADIGYTFDARRTAWLVGGYLVVAFALVVFIEIALAQAGLDAAKLAALSDLADLTPKTTAQRIAFVFMGLGAGLAEEFVYRGFAITALRERRVPAALAVVLAALPFVFQHGLKSVAQFGWFFGWGVVFGVLLLVTRRLHANIVIHWLVILAALPAVLQALR